MNTTTTVPMREALRRLQTLPGIGPRMAADLLLLGYNSPDDLAGADPVSMVERLEVATGSRQDPCVLDVFQCAVYVAGSPPDRRQRLSRQPQADAGQGLGRLFSGAPCALGRGPGDRPRLRTTAVHTLTRRHGAW